MLIWPLFLYVLAALLPLAGLTRVAWRARDAYITKRDAPEVKGPGIMMTIGGKPTLMRGVDIASASDAAAAAPYLGWQQVKWDISLVGGGIVSGAVASIWSLFL